MQAFTVEQVRAARAFLGWSQRELSEASGLSYETIRNFENSRFSDGANASCNAKCLPKSRRRIPPAGQADRRDYYAAVATVVEGVQ
jgi:DNA-binding XRE family transcriptional regulator